MNLSETRRSFRKFAGDERFRKFVRTLNKRSQLDNRLRFWQEELLNAFCITQDREIDEEAVFTVFRVCDVHGSELDHPTDAHTICEIRDTYEFDIAQNEAFPFATGALICQDCYDAYRDWIAQHANLCRILRCQTTYADYCARRLRDFPDLLADSKLKIAQREAEIATEMQHGDELWEWDIGGWHRLTGRAGIAIVRDGQIVKQWCEWKS